MHQQTLSQPSHKQYNNKHSQTPHEHYNKLLTDIIMTNTKTPHKHNEKHYGKQFVIHYSTLQVAS